MPFATAGPLLPVPPICPCVSWAGEKQLKPTQPKRLRTRPVVAVSFLPIVPTLGSLGWGGESQALKEKDASQTRMLTVAESLLSVLPTCLDISQQKREVSRQVGRSMLLLSTHIQWGLIVDPPCQWYRICMMFSEGLPFDSGEA